MKIKQCVLAATLWYVFDMSSCMADDIQHSVTPGVGFFESEFGSYLDIFETSDGFKVEFFLDEGATGGPEAFVGSWETDGWSNLYFDKVLWVSELGIPRGELDFNPFNDPLGGIPFVTGTDVNLPPREKSYTMVAFLEGCDGPCAAPIKLFVEYSVTAIDPPLPGDFNYDDVVDLEDFLILSTNFHSRDPLSWKDGDATLDGFVGFADFLILSANFGAMREPQLTAVPEPSSLPLFGLALCGCGALRKRRAA